MHTSVKIGAGVDSDDGEWNDVIVEKFLPCGKICPGAQVLSMVGRGKRRKLRFSNHFLLLLNYLEELLLCWHCANQGYCLGRRQSKHLKGRSKKASKETCQYECPSHFFESSASRQGTWYLKGRGLGEDDLIWELTCSREDAVEWYMVGDHSRNPKSNKII